MGLSSMQTCGLTIVFCLPLLFTGTVAEMLPSILWNPENPFFKYLGNSSRKVMPFDKLPILCPDLRQYPVKRQNVYSKDHLFENLFLVDKTGYDNCNATMGTEIFRCNNPLESLHTTMVFQPTSAIPSDPLFQQGKEYYFINTASGLEETLNNREGGRCKESSMKMRIYVCRANNDPKCPEGNKVVHGGWSDWSQCIDGLQTRQCNSPFPENGGVPCPDPSRRPCSTKASPTPECKGLSCTTNPEEKTTVQPGIPSKDTRTGDKLTEYDLHMNRGLFVGICLIVLVVGLVVGTVSTLLICHIQRRKTKTNFKITRVPSALSRPVSTFSTASESANMVHT